MANCDIHQAVLALEETLDLLLALQQHEPQSPILGPGAESSPKHEISIAFPTERFRNAVRCLRDQQNLLLLGQFFDRIFTSLYVHLDAYMQESMNSLAPQLELICDIIHATYHLAVESRVDPQPRSHSLSDSVLRPMMNNLLVPIRTLLESMQERLVMGNFEDLPNIYQISSKCSEVLTPILIAVHPLLMWLMKELPFEPQYQPKFIESDRMSSVVQKVLLFPSTLSSIRVRHSEITTALSSIIRLIANATLQGDDNFDGKTKSSFFEDITAKTWKYLQDRSTSCRALELLWMQLDSLLPLLKASDVSKSWVNWQNIPVDPSIVTQNVLLQVEKIQNKSKVNKKEAYQMMASSIKLLLVAMEVSEGIDDIFDDEPQLPSLIWSFVQELMDELSTSEDDIQVSCEALSIQESPPLKAAMEATAVHGMLLLSRIRYQHSQDYPY
ncbi:hypothetical protein BGZ79_009785 [Entomortierella chlamydospora]|nr:hypothetical protein BGZ79_009785 [Entomortierella chlamydospora]